EDVEERSFPSRYRDPTFRAWLGRSGRLGASPAVAARIVEANYEQLRAFPIDHSLVRVPTLVLYRPHNATQPMELAQRVAEEIVGAQLVELPGADDLVFGPDVDALVAEVARFLTGTAKVPPPSRVLSAVLFTDLVSSTEHAAALGDARWKAVLDLHDAAVRTTVGRCAGRVVKTTGDGVLATLPSATAALDAAMQIRELVARQDLEVRIGIHVAEIEMRGDDIAGLGVHVASRIMSAARPGEILVSPTIPPIVTNGSVTFEPRGLHDLKGVPGEWSLFAALTANDPESN